VLIMLVGLLGVALG